jgi:uncharacterized protein YdbL (DUF1318 family)
MSALIGLAGCIKAPNVSVVDSNTALEAQAAGEYHALENDLSQAGLSPRGEPIPREQLAANRDAAGGGALGEVAQLFVEFETDADALDRLLAARCVGEAETGLIVATPDLCTTEVDVAEMTRLVGRANLHRRQLWDLVAAQRGVAPETVATSWRKVHLERVICGGLVQSAGTWEPKPC